MKKLFISQPMKDKTNEEILEERNKIINICKEKYGDIEVIDSFFKDVPHDVKPLWYLGESLKCLSTADIAYFAENWDKYRGCIIEHECCRAYEIEIVND